MAAQLGNPRSQDYEDLPVAYGTPPEMKVRAKEVLDGLRTVRHPRKGARPSIGCQGGDCLSVPPASPMSAHGLGGDVRM